MIFSSCLLQQPQATEAVEKRCFSRISDETLGSFLACFGTSSSFRGTVFSPGRWFFRSCFTAAAAGNRSCRKTLFSRISEETESSEAVEKRCFSRISEATLGSFSAPFRGFFVLHCHGVWGWRIPCFGGLEGGSFELISSLICYRISEATLGSFSAPFRGFVVLHCHGVWGWRIPCFDCDGVWLLVWVMISKKTLPIGGQLMLGYWPPLGINVLSKKKPWFGGKIKDL